VKQFSSPVAPISRKANETRKCDLPEKTKKQKTEPLA